MIQENELYTVDYSKTEQVYILRPSDMNNRGSIFGGRLVEMIDELAAVVAKRHCRSCNVVTAAIDNLIFKKGVDIRSVIVLVGYVTHTSNTSLEIRVDTYVENEDGTRHSINRAYLVFVNLDEDNRPKPVPKLIVRTESEKAEWEAGEKRRELRLERRREGF